MKDASDWERSLLETISRNPGCTSHGAFKASELSRSRFQACLDTLLALGRVVRHSKKLYVATPGLERCLPQVELLRDPKIHHWHSWCLKAGGALERARMLRYACLRLGLTDGTARLRLAQLQRAGLVQEQPTVKDQRHRWLRALQPAEPATHALLGLEDRFEPSRECGVDSHEFRYV